MARRTALGAATFEEQFDALVGNVERVIQGKRDVIQMALACLVADGHLLIEDVPGVGKTMLAKAMARSLDGSWHRIQFTPDLLPSDVTGVSVWNRATNEFEFRAGGIFANIVLADEVNRASPKTQSALLEAMEERQVTVDAVTHDLQRPFMVIATQNPIEYEGTYPLPEAQLDRFMVRVALGYPDAAEEAEMLAEHAAGDRVLELESVTDVSEILAAQQAAARVHASEPLRRYVVALLEATRGDSRLELGASPRAGLMLLKASKALAALEGRDHALPDDVQALATAVLPHRLLLAPDASGSTRSQVVREAIERVPAL